MKAIPPIPAPPARAVFMLGTWIDAAGEWSCGEPREVAATIIGNPVRHAAPVREGMVPSSTQWASVLVRVDGESEPRPVDVERFVRAA